MYDTKKSATQNPQKDFISEKYFSLESNLCDVVALQKAFSQIEHRSDMTDLKYDLLDAISKLLDELKKQYYAEETMEAETAA